MFVFVTRFFWLVSIVRLLLKFSSNFETAPPYVPVRYTEDSSKVSNFIKTAFE